MKTLKTYKILSLFDDSLLAVVKTDDIEQTMSESVFFGAYYEEVKSKEKASMFFKNLRNKWFDNYKLAEFFIRFFIVIYVINAIILTLRNMCFFVVFVDQIISYSIHGFDV